MSYLSIAQGVAKNVGIAVPKSMSSDDPDAQKIGQFINEAGKEIARRVDWSALRKQKPLPSDGGNIPLAIGNDFSRLTRGLAVLHQGNPVRGSLTQDEWFALPPREGAPRYFYLQDEQLLLFPYLPQGDEVSVQYQSKNWVSGGGDAFKVNTEVALFSETLIEAGAVWRWRRSAGKDFNDHMAEFEAMLADLAQFDGGVRSP